MVAKFLECGWGWGGSESAALTCGITHSIKAHTNHHDGKTSQGHRRGPQTFEWFETFRTMPWSFRFSHDSLSRIQCCSPSLADSVPGRLVTTTRSSVG